MKKIWEMYDDIIYNEIWDVEKVIYVYKVLVVDCERR